MAVVKLEEVLIMIWKDRM